MLGAEITTISAVCIHIMGPLMALKITSYILPVPWLIATTSIDTSLSPDPDVLMSTNFMLTFRIVTKR